MEQRLFKTFDDLAQYRKSLNTLNDPDKTYVRLCMTGCRAHGAAGVRDAMATGIEERGLKDRIEIIEAGCLGFCARAPVMVIDPADIFYQGVTAEDAPDIIEKTLINNKVVNRLCLNGPRKGTKIVHSRDIPFYKDQETIVLRNCGRISPTSLAHYIERDGYSALSKALSQMSPEGAIEEVTQSGLRGRGGGGFPTGLKWQFARAARETPKYIICNADEGDPGAFMDRAVLEGDPHSVIEGMLIGGYAIGANEGYIYVRAEYPIAVDHLTIAIAQAEEAGLLGENILGSGFNFKLRIKRGAGAFVCGEETALIASIEGKQGRPRPRPPFPAQSGLWGKPTNINNVETWANIPPIILNSASWFSSLGTEKSKGTKVFALAGKINNTGLVEVPMGISLRKVIFDIGGGIPKDKKFKAAQMGGPSGGCVPAEHLDLPIDYDSLQEVGAIMGSGGMVIVDENNCMVELARFFLEFTQDESCGKCVPCRIGTKRMLEILTRITLGEGREDDLDTLIKLGQMIKDSSLCGLGQTAPNPVLSTIRYFRDEYETHIKEKRCTAGSCKELPSMLLTLKDARVARVVPRDAPMQPLQEKRKGRIQSNVSNAVSVLSPVSLRQ